MRRQLAVCAAALAAVLLAGCGRDDYARKIIVHNTAPGKVNLALRGTGPQLLKQGKIDLHNQIPRPDGTIIDVWVIKARPTAQATRTIGSVVLLHGLTESKGTYPYFGIAERLSKLGYDAVLPDLRAHGRSTGKYVTCGALEKYDVKAVIDHYLKEGTIHTPIYALGNHIGGSVAIQYAAIDSRCQGVMAIVPFKDIASFGRTQIIAPTMTDEEYQDVLERAGEIGDFDPAEASAVEAAAKLKCPLLLVHGVLDVSVPADQSTAIYEAATCPKKLEKPSFEAIMLPVILEDWITGRIDSLARKGLP